MSKETWRPIPGYDGYEVSDLGRVRAVDRVRMLRNRWGDVKPRRYRGRIIAQATNDYGYKCVRLGTHASKEEVHRLVLLAFVGPRPPRHETAHWDGDPANNVLSNLRWATKSENYQDSVRHGTCQWPQ
jgi:NUMOD4 motif/HNH endonuclease